MPTAKDKPVPESDAHARFIDALRQGVDSLKSGRVVAKDEMRRRIDTALSEKPHRPKVKSAAR